MDLNGVCQENGFDHLFEPRTHEDMLYYVKLELCKYMSHVFLVILYILETIMK